MSMAINGAQDKILIVDDEWESPIVKAVRRRLDEDGWNTLVIEPDSQWLSGAEFEAATLYAIEEEQPDAVLLDVRLGDDREDQFKGLEILQKIVEHYPKLPVLMFTQYTQGPERDTAVRGSLKWDSPVDFIDKLASPEEVVLRLRRLIGRTPETISLGSSIVVDLSARMVFARVDGVTAEVGEIHGMKFEIMRELAATWYRSPGELVPFSRLERYSEGEEARASLRVRIREIKVSLGNALKVKFGAGDLIINVRDQGYRLVPPEI
jgi:DNA-binding response OmpR family regulator